jgi:magnesium chelatase subunit H
MASTFSDIVILYIMQLKCRLAYELKPLSEVGHPRIDVLANLSGIFRDSFVNIIELLDDLFRRAAEAQEPEDQNFR